MKEFIGYRGRRSPLEVTPNGLILNTKFIRFIIFILRMVTIAITEENRRKLLSIAADLQKKTGRRVDFDEVISYLTRTYERSIRRSELFELFCKPVEGGDLNTLYAELISERREDEQRI